MILLERYIPHIVTIASGLYENFLVFKGFIVLYYLAYNAFLAKFYFLILLHMKGLNTIQIHARERFVNIPQYEIHGSSIPKKIGSFSLELVQSHFTYFPTFESQKK